jgi:hypothetical protein
MHVGGFAPVASFSQPFLYLEKRHLPGVRSTTCAFTYPFDKNNAAAAQLANRQTSTVQGTKAKACEMRYCIGDAG